MCVNYVLYDPHDIAAMISLNEIFKGQKYNKTKTGCSLLKSVGSGLRIKSPFPTCQE